MNTTVFFATNRIRSGDGTKLIDYAGEAGPAGLPGKLTHATAFITGTDAVGLKTGQVNSIQEVTDGAFFKDVAADLAGKDNLLIFLHGFANGFGDALTRSAFNREWFAPAGTVAAFSWPSGGVVIDGKTILPGLFVAPLSLLLLAAGQVQSPLATAYRADQAAAFASAGDAMSFLDRLRPIRAALRKKGGRVILMAHSMGNHVLRGALEKWSAMGLPQDILFDEAIIAAADTDYAEGQSGPAWLQHLGEVSERVSVYFSAKDSILLLSRGVNGMKRLGDSGPIDMNVSGRYPISRFRFVHCSRLKDTGPEPSLDMSHQYYRRIPEVRDDIRRVIKGTGQAGLVAL